MSFDPRNPDRRWVIRIRRWVIRMWLYVIAVNVVFWTAVAFIVWRIFA